MVKIIIITKYVILFIKFIIDVLDMLLHVLLFLLVFNIVFNVSLEHIFINFFVVLSDILGGDEQVSPIKGSKAVAPENVIILIQRNIMRKSAFIRQTDYVEVI